eukprot:TRINITY_DN31080_c0_g1_i1.p1 TRINITY_DN31080_c0_g1~~TRINITY_DN31080_c0_g1_i1.p1  ORF type:complete len:423 (+),score=69.20 TRINITY_DN31080_c0_g1_i1:69-1271(+)
MLRATIELTGETSVIEGVLEKDTIGALKDKLVKEMGLEKHRFNLTYDGIELGDKDVVGEVGIEGGGLLTINVTEEVKALRVLQLTGRGTEDSDLMHAVVNGEVEITRCICIVRGMTEKQVRKNTSAAYTHFAIQHESPVEKCRLFQIAIDLDPENVRALHGLSLFKEDSPRKDLCKKILEIDSSYAEAYINLASCLKTATTTVELTLEGTPQSLTKEVLYTKCLERKPNNILGLKGLAACLNPTVIVKVGEELFSRLDLRKRIVEIEPELSSSWINLSLEIPHQGLTTLEDGTEISQVDAIQKALEIDPLSAISFNNLSCALAPLDAVVRVGASTYTREELCVKAISLNPRLSAAYKNLEFLLPEGKKVMVEGNLLGGEELLARADEIERTEKQIEESTA